MLHKFYLRSSVFVYATVIFGVSFVLLQLWLIKNHPDLTADEFSIKYPIVLWWTPFTGENGLVQSCGDNMKCFITNDRNLTKNHFIKAYLFYGSNIEIEDMPIPRQDSIIWGLLHEESPRNNPMFTNKAMMDLFNYTATFSRHSDVPLTLLDLPGEDELTSAKYYLTFEEKNGILKEQNLSQVLYIQSDCDTASNRDTYVKELMKHIPIDSYGSCLNNRQLPKKFKDHYLDVLNDDTFLQFAAQYKFTLSFENAVCDDYITEKLWRPLLVGSIPIYYGSPSFKDWLPNSNAAISVRDFAGPKELAEFIVRVGSNNSLYDEFLSHKTQVKKKISNDRLLKGLKSREATGFGDYLHNFECFVCKKIHGNQDQTVERRARNVNLYNCPTPTNPVTGEIDRNNWWADQWDLEQCAAKLFAKHVKNNIPVKSEDFYQDKLKLYEKEDC